MDLAEKETALSQAVVNHDEASKRLLRDMVGPMIAAGLGFAPLLVLLESLVLGVLLFLTETEGWDDKAREAHFRLLISRVRTRIVEIERRSEPR